MQKLHIWVIKNLGFIMIIISTASHCVKCMIKAISRLDMILLFFF